MTISDTCVRKGMVRVEPTRNGFESRYCSRCVDPAFRHFNETPAQSSPQRGRAATSQILHRRLARPRTGKTTDRQDTRSPEGWPAGRVRLS
jgi:hypothetical protein